MRRYWRDRSSFKANKSLISPGSAGSINHQRRDSLRNNRKRSLTTSGLIEESTGDDRCMASRFDILIRYTFLRKCRSFQDIFSFLLCKTNYEKRVLILIVRKGKKRPKGFCRIHVGLPPTFTNTRAARVGIERDLILLKSCPHFYDSTWNRRHLLEKERG